MSFSKLPDTVGFDEQLNVLVVSLNKTANIYLPNFSGKPISVSSGDPKVASVVSDAQLTPAGQKAALDDTKSGGAAGFGAPVLAWFPMNKVVVRGESLGETRLLANLPNGMAWQQPTKVVVVQNPNARQADPTGVTNSLRQELQTMTLRRAAIRVAQDQINSRFLRDDTGDGRYGLPSGMKTQDGKDAVDWCGAFVYWCYRMAANIKGQANPFGPINDVVLSPQKAISWALANPTLATVLRYQGGAFVVWNKVVPPPQRTAIDARPGTNLFPGDVCLVRNETKTVWQHVSMVYDLGDDSFLTLDGNQGLPSMKVVQRDFNQRLRNGQFKFAFLHLNLP